MTRAAFENAMILDMAMGGSTNTVLHILAIAHEAGVDFTLKDIDALSELAPNICKVAPSAGKEGRIYHLEDVQAAGGITTILGELLRGKPGLLREQALTVTGKTIAEDIREHDIRERGETIRREGLSQSKRSELSVYTTNAVAGGAAVVADLDQNRFDPLDCIRTVASAYSQQGGLSILYGNLALDGAVVKTAGVDPEMLRHTGPAVIFESQEEACLGILNGLVKAGDVVVIRYEGPKGGPGMQEMLAPTSYIKGNPALAKTVALITDGRFSGGTAGACIGHVSPEAASGGVIGLLRNGDVIEIDIPGRKLSVRLSEAELAERRKGWTAPAPRYKTGYLAKYTAMAHQRQHRRRTEMVATRSGGQATTLRVAGTDWPFGPVFPGRRANPSYRSRQAAMPAGQSANNASAWVMLWATDCSKSSTLRFGPIPSPRKVSADTQPISRPRRERPHLSPSNR